MAIQRKTQPYRTLGTYLHWLYSNCQKNITLVYRGKSDESWARRCMYLDSKYQPMVPYNHRSVMDCEVVLEFDLEDSNLNYKLIEKVVARLKLDRIAYAVWGSGNKSYHCHVLFKLGEVKNLNLFKTTVMKHYGEFYIEETTNKIFDKLTDCTGKNVKRVWPDLRLASPHLIRAEHGVHEKTQRTKSLVSYSADFPTKSSVPQIIWDEYERAQKNSVTIRMGMQTSDLHNSEIVKMLLDTVQFKENMDDGRERVLFALANILRPVYKKENKSLDELVDFLYEWYCYSSSQAPKLDIRNIKQKVYSKIDYRITESYLRNLLAEITGKTFEELKNKGQETLK